LLIALDAMGGDRGAGEIVRGAAQAAATLDVEILLVGPSGQLQPELEIVQKAGARISIVDADSSIEMAESPLKAVREKPRSSIVIGTELVKRGEAQAFVSAGNTGAVMAAAVLILGRSPGIERPALAAVLPARGGGLVLLLDVGANADCRPAYLVQFAEMGQAFARSALGIAHPRVGLVSIGEEDSKGSQLVLETNERLRQATQINFCGNVEGNGIASGAVDVAVTDGFTGNVILKTAEGAAGFVTDEIRGALMRRWHYRLAAAVLRPALRQVRRRLDYAEYGGAPLLGVRGTVIVAHGRSDSRAIANAVRAARDAAASEPSVTNRPERP
jgi:glycerol-3-phosphate acyltransferase PlsX